ncbi:alpha/beta hydrolase [Crateriforma conspicua]|uniref:alpha/beta hydrolase n=1 Tax=Crateriforma conspicua TaxID=2527996 RepID=UPI001E5C84E6|nr:alpha/beta hydrolase [Crateriforma conspicua]
MDRQFIEGKLPRGVRYVSDVLFKEVDGLELKLDLLLPAKSELEKTPVAVWIHGGAWMRGNKARDLRRFDQLVARVLRRGVAFVSIEYRLSGQATFPAQVVDCNDAIAFLHRNRDQYNLDVGSLILMGSSAGGHLATLVGVTHAKGIPGFSSGYDSSDVHIMGVVDFYGPIDLLKLQGKRDAVDLSSDRSPEARLLGHSPRLRPESARLASPSTHIDPESPPFLIFHGDQDKRVPLDQSELLLSLLQKHGVQSRLVIVEGAVHGDEKFDETSYNDAVLTFMDSLLRESPAK